MKMIEFTGNFKNFIELEKMIDGEGKLIFCEIFLSPYQKFLKIFEKVETIAPLTLRSSIKQLQQNFTKNLIQFVQ